MGLCTMLWFLRPLLRLDAIVFMKKKEREREKEGGREREEEIENR